MNNSEKRRQQLLEQTRSLYHERRFPPAIHPRYGAAYDKLYKEDTGMPYGTLGLRTFLCFLIFAAFVAMDSKGIKIKNIGTDRIAEEISYDIDVSEVWKNL